MVKNKKRKKEINLKKAALMVLSIFLTSIYFAEEIHGPSWLITVPSAEVLAKDELNVGLVYLDLGIAKNIELGLHGIKYSMKNPDSSWTAFGVSLSAGIYPYGVYTKKYDFGKLSLGVKPFPYFVFAGIETPLSKEITFIGEINNGILAGIRTNFGGQWYLDAGAGVSTFPFKNLVVFDPANSDSLNYKFSNSLQPFAVISICYTFNINPSPVPIVVPENKPILPGLQPIDPIKR
jgi:hypothetical protein